VSDPDTPPPNNPSSRDSGLRRLWGPGGPCRTSQHRRRTVLLPITVTPTGAPGRGPGDRDPAASSRSYATEPHGLHRKCPKAPCNAAAARASLWFMQALQAALGILGLPSYRAIGRRNSSPTTSSRRKLSSSTRGEGPTSNCHYASQCVPSIRSTQKTLD
jgi:hypothetical protein